MGLPEVAVTDGVHPTLFGTPDGLGPVGDPLGQVYTPIPLADAVVRALKIGPPEVVVEPSVGGGSFVRAVRARWPSVVVHGVDINPEAAGFPLCDRHTAGDWPTVARYWSRLGNRPVDLVVGNPPFGQAVGLDVTIAHVLAALDLAPIVALVLPLPYLCGAEFDRVWQHQRPARVHRVIGRPWPTRLREVAVFEWRRGSTRTDVVDLGGWP